MRGMGPGTLNYVCRHHCWCASLAPSAPRLCDSAGKKRLSLLFALATHLPRLCRLLRTKIQRPQRDGGLCRCHVVRMICATDPCSLGTHARARNVHMHTGSFCVMLRGNAMLMRGNAMQMQLYGRIKRVCAHRFRVAFRASQCASRCRGPCSH